MRENMGIFRGKRLDNGEWVEGNLLIGNNGRCFIITLCDSSGCFRHNPKLNYIEVDPETVGEWTGLSDKNGKRIFEGDILRGFQYPYLDGDGNHNYLAEVVWFGDCPAFGIFCFKAQYANIRGISGGNTDLMSDWEPNDWDVIGNIHDNQELMEVDHD